MPSDPNEITLLPCPFCGNALTPKKGKVNPYSVCRTEDCFGTRMPVVSHDVPSDLAAWNTRPKGPANVG